MTTLSFADILEEEKQNGIAQANPAQGDETTPLATVDMSTLSNEAADVMNAAMAAGLQSAKIVERTVFDGTSEYIFHIGEIRTDAVQFGSLEEANQLGFSSQIMPSSFNIRVNVIARVKSVEEVQEDPEGGILQKINRPVFVRLPWVNKFERTLKPEDASRTKEMLAALRTFAEMSNEEAAAAAIESVESNPQMVAHMYKVLGKKVMKAIDEGREGYTFGEVFEAVSGAYMMGAGVLSAATEKYPARDKIYSNKLKHIPRHIMEALQELLQD